MKKPDLEKFAGEEPRALGFIIEVIASGELKAQWDNAGDDKAQRQAVLAHAMKIVRAAEAVADAAEALSELDEAERDLIARMAGIQAEGTLH